MAAKLPDVASIIAAGIDPNTGKPLKLVIGNPDNLKRDIKWNLRIVDEQDKINIYKWKDLPFFLSSQELERLIYYKYSLAMFYNKELDQYFILPFAMCKNGIDAYNRYNTIHPVPIGEDKDKNKALAEVLEKIKLDVIYVEDQIKEDIDKTKVAVILRDYTNQLSFEGTPRSTIQDPILDVMAECVPLMRTNMFNSSGVIGVRVNDADQQDSVEQANKSMEKAALTGKPYIPIIGNIDFQELNSGALAKSDEYMMVMQSLDNLRLSFYGISQGGLFDKKAYVNEAQQEGVNGNPIQLVLEDGLQLRKNFCKLANKIWGCNMSVEINESINNEEQEQSLENSNEGDDNNDSTNSESL